MVTWCARGVAAPAATCSSLVVVSTSLAASHVVVVFAGSRVRGLAWLSAWLRGIPAVGHPALHILAMVCFFEGGHHFDDPGHHQPIYSVYRVYRVDKPDVIIVQVPDAVETVQSPGP
jgi:hypothetical protein